MSESRINSANWRTIITRSLAIWIVVIMAEMIHGKFHWRKQATIGLIFLLPTEGLFCRAQNANPKFPIL